MKQQLRDRRRLPFFQVIKQDLAALATACETKEVTVKLSSARSVYFALLELANDERSSQIEITRAGLGDLAGVSSRTIFDAVQALQIAGLLESEKSQGEVTIWTLISVDDPGNHCRGPRQPLPGSYVIGQEEKKTPTPSNDVATIFEAWQKVLKHPSAKLDADRRRIIRKALQDSSVDECLMAIRGCAASDYHMARGQYKGGTVYDHLSLILRSREKVEWFIERAPQRAGNTGLDDFTSSEVRAKIIKAKRTILESHAMAGNEALGRESDESERLLQEQGWVVVREAGERPRFEPVADPDATDD